MKKTIFIVGGILGTGWLIKKIGSFLIEVIYLTAYDEGYNLAKRHSRQNYYNYKVSAKDKQRSYVQSLKDKGFSNMMISVVLDMPESSIRTLLKEEETA